jgi:hypothetical protein
MSVAAIMWCLVGNNAMIMNSALGRVSDEVVVTYFTFQ